MNFNYLTIEDRQNMAACLGGLTYGATTVEMASGYATIENDGEYRKPTCIREITAPTLLSRAAAKLRGSALRQPQKG